MYWSELLHRDIIDLETGARLGSASEVDFVLNEKTGEIQSMVLPGSSGLLGLLGTGDPVEIPWSSVYRIGPDVILVKSSRASVADLSDR